MRDKPDSKPDFMGLFSLSSTQGGYFRAEQAHKYGYSTERLSYYNKTGKFQRVRRGLYRLRDYPHTSNQEVVAAWVGIGRNDAFVSHLTALAWHGLGDLFREKIDITIPRSARYIQSPQDVALHTITTAPVSGDVQQSGPIKVSSPLRAILECIQLHIAPDQLDQAVVGVIDNGMVSVSKLKRVIEDLPSTSQQVLTNSLLTYTIHNEN